MSIFKKELKKKGLNLKHKQKALCFNDLMKKIQIQELGGKRLYDSLSRLFLEYFKAFA